jgi:hypothetical protein
MLAPHTVEEIVNSPSQVDGGELREMTTFADHECLLSLTCLDVDARTATDPARRTSVRHVSFALGEAYTQLLELLPAQVREWEFIVGSST